MSKFIYQEGHSTLEVYQAVDNGVAVRLVAQAIMDETDAVYNVENLFLLFKHYAALLYRPKSHSCVLDLQGFLTSKPQQTLVLWAPQILTKTKSRQFKTATQDYQQLCSMDHERFAQPTWH